MANIKKNFNFRNGVQVDDDNLLVTTTGLVGIGTTVPTEALDVRGDVNVSGFATITKGNVGFLTVTTLEPTEIVGAGINIKSGVVTSQVPGTGIVTFYGDARYLQGMPTSQWDDVDVGLGYTSIFNTGGNVGISTIDPRSSLQIGGKVDSGQEGVGISSVGNVRVSGIVTASSFVGNVTGDVTGRITGDVVGNINSSGVSTAVTLDVNGDLDVDGHTNLDNLSVAGVSTFTGLIDGNGGATIDNIQIGVTGDNEIDTSTGNLTIDSSGGTTTIDDNLTISGETNAVNVVASGVITATTELNSPLIGVGTDTPANAIQVRKTGNVEIQITSDTGAAGLTVGREAGLNNTNNGEFRYGGGGGFPYSSDQSLDIINYGTGNFNYHLSANNAGSTAGNFFWHKGSSNVRLMTLTNSGRLGIGLTEPTDELHVAGGATVDGALAVGGNINVTGTLVGNVQGTLTGNVSGTLAGNSNTTVGISTFNNISVAGIATIQNQRSANLSIGDNPQVDKLLKVFISGTQQVFVNDVGQVGILTTTSLPGVGINASSTNMSVAAIGVGVTQFDNGAVNLSNAGLSTNRFMVPPTVTTTQRNNLVGLISGAMIYNTSINKLQVYTGSAWETITSS